MITTRENKMDDSSKAQYQHLGAGTAIFTRKGLNTQRTKNDINNGKLISTVIQANSKGNKILVVAH